MLLEPWTSLDGRDLGIRPLPGTRGQAKIRPRWSELSVKTLTKLAEHVSGIGGTPLGPIDFTGAWHDEEVFSVLSPGFTFAIDPSGRRWIAEIHEGRFGPVWCVLSQPQVVIFISETLEDFFQSLRRHLHFDTFSAWIGRLDQAAEFCWQHRGALAFQGRGNAEDRRVRRWLLTLPRDARVYDLRTPRFGHGFPYGSAGTAHKLHRFETLPLFAISGLPTPARWSSYLGELASRIPIPRPGVEIARESSRVASAISAVTR